MKKLLYISYLFPPVGGSGVQRSLKFAKYLPDYGWEPIMLVADHRFLKQPKDHSLAEEIPKSLRVYRSFAPDLRWIFKLLWGLRLHKVVNYLLRNFLIPDPEIIWLPFAKIALKRIFAEHKIDLVFITAPPYAPLFLGEYIKKHFHTDFCVDFRDPWTNGVGRQYNPPPLRIRNQEKAQEKRILSLAKQVVCINDTMVKVLRASYPHILQTKLHCITNGYDEEDFSACTKQEPTEKMHIVYTGAFYDLRQPGIIWQAISELISEGNLEPQKLSIDIYGNNYAGFVLGNYAQDPIISTIVTLKAYLPHSESVDRICKADLLLIYSGSGKAEEMNSPAKLFEYLRSGVPILAIVDPKSAASSILEPSLTSFFADSGSVASIKEQIHALYLKWEQRDLTVQSNVTYIKSFERKALTAKLAQVIDAAVENV
ncbi:MAG: hypothetical protein PHH43_06950 [Candidatus Cloacimonetes bacterium]|nr:hypothetical protein [Candidatus Cloacimonadota bacterium]